MTLSIWRYAHFTLAVVSSLFLVLAAGTGIILATDAVGQKLPTYKVENFEELTLSDVIPVVKDSFLEISELQVTHNQFVIVKGLDENGDEIVAIVNPNTGKVIGKPEKESEFIQWVTSLHRSLFLHDTGRIFIGINAFLLLLIATSGFFLVVQRQHGIKRFFATIPNEGWNQFIHVFTGRWMLVPIFIIAISGTYLSLNRFKWFDEFKINHQELSFPKEAPEQQEIKSFKSFQSIKLSEVQKIEFPFTDDVEEFYKVKLTTKEILVNQFDGTILSEVTYPKTVLLEILSLDLHTGRSSAIWAVVLGIASISILIFIYTGFALSFKRMKNKIKNTFKAEESTIIILVGSENGSTLGFANAFFTQLIQSGKKVFLTEMNQLNHFPKAEQIVIFTATHGLGEAPSNASNFEKLIQKTTFNNKVQTCVVGFGSTNYPDFCGFAKKVEKLVKQQSWNETLVELHTINDKSVADFISWIKAYNAINQSEISTTPALYINQSKELQEFSVIAKTTISDDCQTYVLSLKPKKKLKFQSGDLLAIYPGNEGKERLYSIGKVDENIQLVIKLHDKGLGSGFMYDLNIGSVFKARIIENKTFHPPVNKELILIGNGTGIAPFLGLIHSNSKKIPIHLFIGYRKETALVSEFKAKARDYISFGYLSQFHLALSREGNSCYVTHLVAKEANTIATSLQNGGTVMICGSIAMQNDVLEELKKICEVRTKHNFDFYLKKGQILTDCY